MTTLIEKQQLLMSVLKKSDSLAVAFSGGADSSFLLAAAYQALEENVMAVTAVSPIHSRREKRAAIAFTKRLGIRHVLINSDEMNIPEFIANTKHRCYVCKKQLFKEIAKAADAANMSHIAHGANMDDLNDFRPGFKAATEMGVSAPLIDAGLTKSDIRRLSQEMKLSSWNRPAMACLATRIPYNTPISSDKLKMIEDAEEYLLSLGISQVRVRHHDSIARIEVLPAEFDVIIQHHQAVIEKLKKIGFLHISLDLAGYVQGSMNI
jgi:pyridinium-3,5-biscarboxylic acid mononucleotide sulfurtransferase